ncbi:MAG TPA: MFS transporter [Stackebrandtia sp.]|jgi:MFS family permease|uniref:MFS transporter n=1 Tax=Stackebrandtia sp. TaxID=2023065 RepID=UPI002D61D62D|nr:MFS transporter [Stackebrandtia sp.]HZE39398.1 MFS transporter [Stackebrandtia sp.]
MSTLAPSPARPAHRDPAYLRFTTGQAISVLGDQIWYVALSWAAVKLASPGVAGMVLTVSSIPRLVLLLFGGVFVDRFGPKRLMIGSDLLRTAVALGAAAIALAAPSIGLLVAVGLVFGVVSAVFMPASGAMTPLLLREEQLTGGVALRTLTARLALTLGAPLGGAIVAIGGLPLAATVDAATFLLSAATLWTLRPREVAAGRRPRGGTRAALTEGLRYLWRHRLLRDLHLTGLFINLGFVGPMNVGLAVLSQQRGWGAVGIGGMLAGFGGGAAASALLLLRVKPKRALGYRIAACALVQAVAVLGLGLAPNLWVAVAITVVIGLVSGVMGVLLGSLVQANTDDAFRGRVSSVSNVLDFGITPLAMAATGFGVSAFGLSATFAASAGLLAVGGSLAVWRSETRDATLA